MQIVNTLKCNFSCRHCMFSCCPKKKDMLDNYTLSRFIESVGCYADFINYCGGETFLNPYWKWQIEYLSRCTDSLRIVTNGSKFYTRSGNHTKMFKEFIGLLYEIQFNCYVTILISDDYFHEEFYLKKDLYPLHSVIEDFKFDCPENVSIETDNRKFSNYVAPFGRALKTECYTNSGECMGDTFEPCLAPNGDVFGCCNMCMKVGTILDSYDTWEENHSKYVLPKNCLVCKYK